MPPGKPVEPAKPVSIKQWEPLVGLPGAFRGGLLYWNGLTNVAPVPLLPKPGILPDAQGLFQCGGIRKYDVTVTPILRQGDSGARGSRFLASEKES